MSGFLCINRRMSQKSVVFDPGGGMQEERQVAGPAGRSRQSLALARLLAPARGTENCKRSSQGAGKGRSPCRRRSRGFRAKRGSSFLGGGAGGGTPPLQRFFPGLRGRGDAATLLKLRASSFWQGGVAALRRKKINADRMAFPPLPSTASQYDLRLRRRPRLRRGLRGFVGDAGKRALFPAPCVCVGVGVWACAFA